MTIPRWVERYLGIPYCNEDKGRAGLHCWALVRMVLAERAGVVVSPYGEVSASDLLAVARAMDVDRQAGVWRQVQGSRRDLDVVLMTGPVAERRALRRLPVHCGIAIGSEYVLHVWEATHSICVRADDFSIRNRIIESYRHAAIA